MADVLSEPGRYVLPIIVASDQRDLIAHLYAEQLAERFGRATNVLIEHQRSGELKTVKQLALNEKEFTAAKHAAKLVDGGTPITMGVPGRDAGPLPVPPSVAKQLKRIPNRLGRSTGR
jgi:hypothetical protein